LIVVKLHLIVVKLAHVVVRLDLIAVKLAHVELPPGEGKLASMRRSRPRKVRNSLQDK
jgi:hypothetical protein